MNGNREQHGLHIGPYAWVITKRTHAVDRDNYPTTSEEHLLEDEGLFSDQATAQARAHELGRVLRNAHRLAEKSRAAKHRTLVRKVRSKNRENAILRRSGVRKADAPVPVFAAQSFDEYVEARSKTEVGVSVYEATRVSAWKIIRLSAPGPGKTINIGRLEGEHDNNSTPGSRC